MVGQQELQVQQKREVEKGQEATRPTRAFMPNADIFETEDALTVVTPAADIAGVDMARAKMGPMEKSALRWKSPWVLDGKLAFILAIPIMNARGVHLDQNETSRLNAVFKPTLEILCPMRLELVLVTN